MPGDTLGITSFADSLPLHDSMNQLRPALLPDNTGANDVPGVFLFVSLLAIVVGIPFLVNWLKGKFLQKQAFTAASAALRANYLQYDELLAAHNGYYKSLPAAMRARFLERMARFTATKTITCVDLPKDERMPLLIAAASVQISFGLDKYLLDFFDTIYVMQHNYQYGAFEKPFEGHVNSNGIYLSWDNFLKGFADYTRCRQCGYS